MTAASIGELVAKLGVEPAVIAALLYIVYKQQKAVTDLTSAVVKNTSALERLAEWVREVVLHA